MLNIVCRSHRQVVWTTIVLLASGLALSAAILQANEPQPQSKSLPQNELTWAEYDGVSIPLPPAEHPRLYLRARNLPELHRRITAPATKPFWQKMQQAAKKDRAIAIEVDAVRYLLTSDAELGRRTVAAALDLLTNSQFDMKQKDITRPIGRLMVTGAVVYDWCYPLLTAEQKQAYVEQLLRWARLLEFG